jgi:dipeptidyl aminopeptidase/acylaminoacyl peptidase
LDLSTNELTQINDDAKEAVFIAYSWDKTGERIYAVSDEGKEFQTLIQYNVKTGDIDLITEDIPWDVGKFVTNPTKTKAAFTVNENGFSQLCLLVLQSSRYEKVEDLPIGQIYSIKFHPEKEELAMVLNTTETPGDIYSLDLKTMNNKRWIFSEVGGLNTSTFPKPELIHYETYDDMYGEKRKIPAFIYTPDNADGPFPVLISIHGGPEGQHVPYFS